MFRVRLLARIQRQKITRSPLPCTNFLHLPTPKIACRSFSEYPAHTVIAMPALSPTMTEGTITSWHLKEGDEIKPGSVICEVETDKATVDFEAQDDGFLAKILVPKNSKKIAVGEPIGVMCEEKDDVPSFKDFVAPGKSTKKEQIAPPKPAKVDSTSTPVTTPSVTKIEKMEPVKKAVPAASQTQGRDQQNSAKENVANSPAPADKTSSTIKQVPPQVQTKSNSKAHGPLDKMLAKEQQQYQQLYGITMMRPISIEPTSATPSERKSTQKN